MTFSAFIDKIRERAEVRFACEPGLIYDILDEIETEVTERIKELEGEVEIRGRIIDGKIQTIYDMLSHIKELEAQSQSEGEEMKWIETTDKNNPLSCRGEYCMDIPWLEHSTNGGMAYYSVRKDISGSWESMFWHGNRGHSVGKPAKTEIGAKAECLEHLKRMYAEFSVQIDGILGDGESR